VGSAWPLSECTLAYLVLSCFLLVLLLFMLLYNVYVESK
jgi:hypothetical protein